MVGDTGLSLIALTVPNDGVARLENAAEVSTSKEGRVVPAKVARPRHLHVGQHKLQKSPATQSRSSATLAPGWPGSHGVMSAHALPRVGPSGSTSSTVNSTWSLLEHSVVKGLRQYTEALISATCGATGQCRVAGPDQLF